MNPAKLGRSRNVSERDPVKLDNINHISCLAAQARAWPEGRAGDELARQATNVVGKFQLTGHEQLTQLLYVFSGEHRTAYLTREARTR